MKIVPEKSATIQPVQNIPKKVKRKLNQDERLILSTIAIMVLMMLGGLLLGYATMD
jgi:cell division protein FtsL